ncbi:MAG: NADP-dependent oxidoreductase [Acetobacteraceae bacterium]|nr:NADP-dependent oxidoreductase [Acetobacteraceae bacterium]
MRNHRLKLVSRPTGIPGPEHFSADDVPTRDPGDGEVLVETIYLSIDPAMRSWITDGTHYARQVQIGAVMEAGGIARVVTSRAPDLAPGDLIQGRLGWQSHPTLLARRAQKLDLSLGSAEDWIGPLGLTGVTAYFGLREIGQLRPGSQVLVSAAAGGVGQIVGQIARIEGCHVVGIAGGVEKCAFITNEIGYDAAIDYRTAPDLSAAIGAACPEGLDLYFDNVGGATLDAALNHLRQGARVVVCGRISQFAGQPAQPIHNLGKLMAARARMEGFIVFAYADRYHEARAWLATQLRAGRLTQRLHVLDGLAQSPAGLGMLFTGENTGKLVVRVA